MKKSRIYMFILSALLPLLWLACSKESPVGGIGTDPVLKEGGQYPVTFSLQKGLISSPKTYATVSATDAERGVSEMVALVFDSSNNKFIGEVLEVDVKAGSQVAEDGGDTDTKLTGEFDLGTNGSEGKQIKFLLVSNVTKSEMGGYLSALATAKSKPNVSELTLNDVKEAQITKASDVAHHFVMVTPQASVVVTLHQGKKQFVGADVKLRRLSARIDTEIEVGNQDNAGLEIRKVVVKKRQTKSYLVEKGGGSSHLSSDENKSYTNLTGTSHTAYTYENSQVNGTNLEVTLALNGKELKPIEVPFTGKAIQRNHIYKVRINRAHTDTPSGNNPTNPTPTEEPKITFKVDVNDWEVDPANYIQDYANTNAPVIVNLLQMQPGFLANLNPPTATITNGNKSVTLTKLKNYLLANVHGKSTKSKAVVSQGWVQVNDITTYASYGMKQQFQITVAENTTGTDRTATVEFRNMLDENNKTVLTITQKGNGTAPVAQGVPMVQSVKQKTDATFNTDLTPANITLQSNNTEVGTEKDQTYFVATTDVTVTAAANANWITAGVSNGTEVKVTVKPNTTGAARTGTITLTNFSQTSKTTVLTITQKGAGTAPTTAVAPTVTSVTEKDATFTTNVSPSTINVTSNNTKVGTEKDQTYFIATTDVAVTASTTANWITATVSNHTEVIVVIKANSGAARTGMITLKNTADPSKTTVLTITQKGTGTAPTTAVAPTVQSVEEKDATFANPATTSTIQVNSTKTGVGTEKAGAHFVVATDVPVQAVPSNSWIHIGTVGNEVRVTVDANPGVARTGTVTLKNATDPSKTTVLTITQKGTGTAPTTAVVPTVTNVEERDATFANSVTTPTIQVDLSKKQVGTEKAGAHFVVATDVAVNASVPPASNSWISIGKAPNGEVRVIVKPNSGVARTGTVTLQNASDISKTTTITITQKGTGTAPVTPVAPAVQSVEEKDATFTNPAPTPTIQVNPTKTEVGTEKAGAHFVVATDTPAQAVPNDSWIHTNVVNGNEVRVTVDANTGTDRTGTVTLKNATDPSKTTTITVKQKGTTVGGRPKLALEYVAQHNLNAAGTDFSASYAYLSGSDQGYFNFYDAKQKAAAKSGYHLPTTKEWLGIFSVAPNPKSPGKGSIQFDNPFGDRNVDEEITLNGVTKTYQADYTNTGNNVSYAIKFKGHGDTNRTAYRYTLIGTKSSGNYNVKVDCIYLGTDTSKNIDNVETLDWSNPDVTRRFYAAGNMPEGSSSVKNQGEQFTYWSLDKVSGDTANGVTFRDEQIGGSPIDKVYARNSVRLFEGPSPETVVYEVPLVKEVEKTQNDFTTADGTADANGAKTVISNVPATESYYVFKTDKGSEIHSNDGWVHVQKDASDALGYTFKVTVDANTALARVGTFELSNPADSGKKTTITLNQLGGIAGPGIESIVERKPGDWGTDMTPTSVYVENSNTQVTTLKAQTFLLVKTDMSVDVSQIENSDPTWLTIQDVQGTQGKLYRLTVGENNGKNAKTGYITFKNPADPQGGITRLNVIQKPKPKLPLEYLSEAPLLANGTAFAVSNVNYSNPGAYREDGIGYFTYDDVEQKAHLMNGYRMLTGYDWNLILGSIEPMDLANPSTPTPPYVSFSGGGQQTVNNITERVQSPTDGSIKEYRASYKNLGKVSYAIRLVGDRNEYRTAYRYRYIDRSPGSNIDVVVVDAIYLGNNQTVTLGTVDQLAWSNPDVTRMFPLLGYAYNELTNIMSLGDKGIFSSFTPQFSLLGNFNYPAVSIDKDAFTYFGVSIGPDGFVPSFLVQDDLPAESSYSLLLRAPFIEKIEKTGADFSLPGTNVGYGSGVEVSHVDPHGAYYVVATNQNAIVTSKPDWVTVVKDPSPAVQGHVFKVTIANNPGLERTGELVLSNAVEPSHGTTVTFKQDTGYPAPRIIDLTERESGFVNEATTKTATISEHNTKIDAIKLESYFVVELDMEVQTTTPSSSWISLTKIPGKTQSYQMAIGRNDTGSERTAYIDFANPDDPTVITRLNITQSASGLTAPGIVDLTERESNFANVVTQKTATISSNKTKIDAIKIESYFTAELDMEVVPTVSDSWITVTKGSGNTYQVTIGRNDTGYERTGYIDFANSKDPTSVTRLNIRQNSIDIAAPTYTIKERASNFVDEAVVKKLEYFLDTKYHVSRPTSYFVVELDMEVVPTTSDSWISLTKVPGKTVTYQMTIGKNQTGSERTGKVEFANPKDPASKASVTIIQGLRSPYPEFDATSYEQYELPSNVSAGGVTEGSGLLQTSNDNGANDNAESGYGKQRTLNVSYLETRIRYTFADTGYDYVVQSKPNWVSVDKLNGGTILQLKIEKNGGANYKTPSREDKVVLYRAIDDTYLEILVYQEETEKIALAYMDTDNSTDEHGRDFTLEHLAIVLPEIPTTEQWRGVLPSLEAMTVMDPGKTGGHIYIGSSKNVGKTFEYIQERCQIGKQSPDEYRADYYKYDKHTFYGIKFIGTLFQTAYRWRFIPESNTIVIDAIYLGSHLLRSSWIVNNYKVTDLPQLFAQSYAKGKGYLHRELKFDKLFATKPKKGSDGKFIGSARLFPYFDGMSFTYVGLNIINTQEAFEKYIFRIRRFKH